jgi:hypothetical protein
MYSEQSDSIISRILTTSDPATVQSDTLVLLPNLSDEILGADLRSGAKESYGTFTNNIRLYAPEFAVGSTVYPAPQRPATFNEFDDPNHTPEFYANNNTSVNQSVLFEKSSGTELLSASRLCRSVTLVDSFPINTYLYRQFVRANWITNLMWYVGAPGGTYDHLVYRCNIVGLGQTVYFAKVTPTGHVYGGYYVGEDNEYVPVEGEFVAGYIDYGSYTYGNRTPPIAPVGPIYVSGLTTKAVSDCFIKQVVSTLPKRSYSGLRQTKIQAKNSV